MKQYWFVINPNKERNGLCNELYVISAKSEERAWKLLDGEVAREYPEVTIEDRRKGCTLINITTPPKTEGEVACLPLDGSDNELFINDPPRKLK